MLEYEVDTLSAHKYGYLLWSNKRIPELKDFFPKSPFSVEIEGKTLTNRKFDDKKARLNLYPARKLIKKGMFYNWKKRKRK